jgi:hypothetical protein
MLIFNRDKKTRKTRGIGHLPDQVRGRQGLKGVVSRGRSTGVAGV